MLSAHHVHVNDVQWYLQLTEPVARPSNSTRITGGWSDSSRGTPSDCCSEDAGTCDNDVSSRGDGCVAAGHLVDRDVVRETTRLAPLAAADKNHEEKKTAP